jgi:hypothetical protein
MKFKKKKIKKKKLGKVFIKRKIRLKGKYKDRFLKKHFRWKFTPCITL